MSSEAESLKSLLNIAGILALVFGVLYIIIGIPTMFYRVGVLFIIWGVIDIIIYFQIREIIELIEKGRYKEAKDKTLTWMIIGFILAGIIIGVILLIAYMKYDTLIKRKAIATAPPPPPPA